MTEYVRKKEEGLLCEQIDGWLASLPKLFALSLTPLPGAQGTKEVV